VHSQSASPCLPRESVAAQRLRPGMQPPVEPAVHVIDDDDSFRRSMLRILQASGYAATGYGCAGEFLLALRGEAAGCILLDISMPGPSGIELLRALMQRGSVPPAIFVTARDDIMTSVDAMKLGAFDYLVKPVGAERMLAVVERAMQVDARRVTARCELLALCSRFALLTNQERAIFVGVFSHRLNKQMAGDLGTCERTIKALRARMMAKLGVATVPALVRVATLLEDAGVAIEPAATSDADTMLPRAEHRSRLRLTPYRLPLLQRQAPPRR
jgi:FixJ family two-component response regulator